VTLIDLKPVGVQAEDTSALLHAALQPIVSWDGTVLGHEALLRGCDPGPLFSAARHEGWQLALDIQAAELALEAAARVQLPGEALFLNVAPGPVGDLRLWLATVCAHPDVRLGDLIVEISEKQSDVLGPELAGFVRAVRACGARVALDDVEPDADGLEMVMTVRPDVVKLSRCGVTAFQGWLMGHPATGSRPDTAGWGGLSGISLLA
jgi:EAL domain-containing protein (putative c-di-GMP-specific phosphodiesterase class I)